MLRSLDVWRAPLAEAVATALLLAIVVGTGLQAERLHAEPATALLICAGATAAGLIALLVAFGPISGAHLNPAVTLALAATGDVSWRAVPGYLLAQTGGAFVGVVAAHTMFDRAWLSAATNVRSGFGTGVGEFVATATLLLVVFGCVRTRSTTTPFAVAATIFAGYWFTSSTSFANPAVTLARAFTDSPAGIRFADVPLFLGAQVLGTLFAVALQRLLWPRTP